MRRAWRIALFALAGLGRAPLRVTLTTLGVTVAASALVTMVAFALGLQRQAETPFRLLDLFKNIQVTPKKAGEADDAVALDDTMLQRMEEIPGVAVVYPDIRVKGLKLSRGDRTATGLGMAVPREALFFGTAEELLVAGRFFSEQPLPEAVLGKQLVRELGFASPEEAVGTKITVTAAGLAASDPRTFTFQRKQIEVEVVGVFDVPPLMPGHADRAVLLPVELMKEIPRLPDGTALDLLKRGKSATEVGYRSATVRVRNRADLAPVEARIRQMGFDTRTVLSQFEQMRLFFVFLDVLLASVGTVALLVAALGIVNTLLMSVMERYQEIGIYKAIGASDGDLVVLFLTEAGLIGFLGGLAGLGLGWAVSRVLEFAVNLYARNQGVTGHLDLFGFPWWLLAAAVLFSVVVSVLAGVYPALRAARIDPIRVLRREW